MCGIVGRISLGTSTVTERHLRHMLRAVAHRGPDDSGHYLNPDQTVGLGHARLSVIDPSPAGHQPMSWQGRYWITYNGEIYNFQELKNSIDQPLRSHTDTEVILALYAKYGPACVERLNGMFSFAIYDAEQDVLFCARDRFGQKPFKYAHLPNHFLFASGAQAILTQAAYKKQIDDHAIQDYLTFGYCPAPATGFKDIHKLPPGHTLTLDIKRRQLTLNRYWQPPRQPASDRTSSSYAADISQTLDAAVRRRLIADVPLGAFLSGGLDSSLIVGLMARHSPQPVKTFSIGFPEVPYNELPYARLVAKTFKTDHTELVITPSDITSAEDLAQSFDEPFADSSALATYALSKLTRRHVTVALSGDGGDELFGGYKRYQWFRYLSRFGRLGQLAGLASRRLKQYSAAYPDTTKQYQDMVSIFLSAEQKLPFTHNSRYTDMKTYLPDDLLAKIDITSMAHALEVRSPFLDHTLIKAIADIPDKLVRNKSILKQAFADMLPPEILRRDKRGFTVPLKVWLKGDLVSYAASTLRKPAADLKRLTHDQVWALLMLQLWRRHYFDI